MPLEFDTEFPKGWPFGVLKTIQWLAPLGLLITLYMGTYLFNGVGIAIFSGWNAFLYSLITWICYVLGVHKKAFSFNQGAGQLFIPFALMDFLVSLFFMLFFGISTLVCAICIFEGLKYRFGVFLTYLFATGFSLISGLAYGYFAILVYRACPNGQLRNLSSLVIDADGTSARPTMETNIPTSTSRPTMVV
uniref:MARVEL domain-containing protein n=1 Tax=Panagrolaimus superbus TaxID=310955 RepID=A0A914Y3Z3_9BILA